MEFDDLDDAELVQHLGAAPEAFAALYRRYERPVLAYMVRRVASADVAADLTAETFAGALAALRRGAGPTGPLVNWLFGIARNKLRDAYRRGSVDDAMRRALHMQPVHLDDLQAQEITQLASDDAVARLVADLPAEQAQVVLARVIDDRDYADIARELACSEAVVRKRVSRGLATLRTRLEGVSR
jgi:RNA polymerase sigma factor (sigma-70 family)